MFLRVYAGISVSRSPPDNGRELGRERGERAGVRELAVSSVDDV
jgi:hypothetical protein